MGFQVSGNRPTVITKFSSHSALHSNDFNTFYHVLSSWDDEINQNDALFSKGEKCPPTKGPLNDVKVNMTADYRTE